jgi:precorrin-2 dehydrogenase/sirohydrochlorin ferrochelatase
MTDRPPLPDPPPGPGYPVVLRLAGRPCLVVGGGAVAARRVRGLLTAGARVTVVAPRVEPSIEESATGGELEVDRRPYEPGEAGGFFLVLTATGRPEVDAMVVADAASAGALVAGADRDEDTSVQLPAVRRVDRVTIAVSTGGSTPALSRWLADRVAAVVPEGVGTLVSLVEEAREALRSNDLPTDSLPWADILDDVISPLVAAGRTDEARARLLELCRPDGHPGQSTR